MHGSNTGRDTAPARVCSRCRCWPCTCARPAASGMEFAIRNEACGWCRAAGYPNARIIAGGSEASVAAAIRAHQATPEHRNARAQAEGGQS